MINSTEPAIAITNKGSNSPSASVTCRPNASCCIVAARSSIMSSSPLRSPDMIMCRIIGENSAVPSSDGDNPSPSRTRSIAASIRSRAASLLPALMRIASSNGTALAFKMLSVLA